MHRLTRAWLLLIQHHQLHADPLTAPYPTWAHLLPPISSLNDGSQTQGQGTPPESTFQASYTQKTPCPVCGSWVCGLQTHRAFVQQHRATPASTSRRAPESPPHVAPLMNSSFALSYAFNPLHPARYTELGASSLGFSDDVPILNDSGQEMHAALHTYLTRDVSQNVAFDDPTASPFDESTSQWLMMASADSLTITSMLSLWSLIEHGWNPHREIATFSLKVQSQFTVLLREYLQNDSKPSSPNSILFAAAHQLMCVNYFSKEDHDQREKLMDGLEELVKSYGGFRALLSLVPDGVVTNLLWADSQVSFLNAAAPRFRHVNVPSRPSSLRSVDLGTINEAYWRCTSPEILSNVKPMRLLLMFRKGSSCRPSSREEFRYLVALFRYIDIQLSILQARYAGLATASECIVLGMGLVRVGGVTRWKHHYRLAKGLLDRLERVLEMGLQPWIEYDSLCCLIWVCVIALLSVADDRRRQVLQRILLQCLERQMGDGVPITAESLHAHFLQTFTPLLWHSEMDAMIYAMCVDLVGNRPRWPS